MSNQETKYIEPPRALWPRRKLIEAEISEVLTMAKSDLIDALQAEGFTVAQGNYILNLTLGDLTMRMEEPRAEKVSGSSGNYKICVTLPTQMHLYDYKTRYYKTTRNQFEARKSGKSKQPIFNVKKAVSAIVERVENIRRAVDAAEFRKIYQEQKETAKATAREYERRYHAAANNMEFSVRAIDADTIGIFMSYRKELPARHTDQIESWLNNLADQGYLLRKPPELWDEE